MNNKEISYYEAINFFQYTNLILCNNIAEIDDSIYENAEFDFDIDKEIFQFYITNLNDFEKDYLKKRFNLLFTYSNLLQKWILCTDFFGINWKEFKIIDNGE